MTVSLPAGDIKPACVLGFCYILLLAVAELWSRVGHAKPEWTRKLVHVAGGLLCLSFPFVFQSAWTVLALAGTMTVLFVIGAETGSLQSLHRVKRRSCGSEYYPLSIFLLFILSDGRPWLYVASLLVLAMADGFAALIGIRYGRIRYEVENETKSLEGSMAFMLIAFLAIVIPLTTMTNLPAAICVWSALLVAILVTGFEAICLTGTDNLFVPLATCVVLSKITTKPLAEIVYQNASLIGLLCLVALPVRRVRSLNVGGALTLVLFVYGCWSLGSERWAYPVLIAFGLYLLAARSMPLDVSLKVAVVFRAVLAPLLVLVVSNMYHRNDELYAPFVVSIATVLALVLWNHTRPARGLPPVNGEPNQVWPATHLGMTAIAALLTYALERADLMAWLAR